MKRILAHGTFDIIHYGHLNYLEKAKSYGDYLIVLVSSDEIVKKKKGKKPFFNEKNRLRMIEALKIVDEVILRETPITNEMIKDLNIDIFVTTKEYCQELNQYCQVILVDRTKEISSTAIKNYLSTKE